jgi:hypothetical protein
MTRHPYGDVLARVRAYIAADGQGEQGVYELYRIQADAACALGGVAGYVRDEQHQGAQVRRAMDAIVRERALIKVSRNEYGPDGIRDGRWPRYYTPAAFKRAEAAYAGRQDAAAICRRQWEKVHDDLRASGFAVLTPRGEPVHLNLEDWERLTWLLQPHLEVRA